ncbi:DUF1906 domain-containing protein [Cohnella nanjingensis]|uniref:DUF1906 domain-containing protein n=1 Tax=Cohnella nanjingensis TaxID=1387779 RepID=A0A7X0RSS7_9BACL|nr:DUF1906 domain-containing protein [Cohnella nanjingensis]
MRQGIDCAQPLTTSTAGKLYALNYRFAARYLVPADYSWKRLTRKEAEAISAAGLQIVSVFETSANRPEGGAAAGVKDGIAAYKEAQAIKQPLGTAIYFAVDYDAKADDFDTIAAYLKAAAAQIPGYSIGVYGSYTVVEAMAKRGVASKFWQTYAWSGGKRSARAEIYQYKNDVNVEGIRLDKNEGNGSEGAWSTVEIAQEAMTAEDANKIIKFLSAAWGAASTQEDKLEFNRLANELRKVSGQPFQ